MRVLLSCWLAQGHLLLMVPLLRAAQRAGHEVVVSSGRDLAGAVTRLPDRATISAPLRAGY